MKKLVLFVLALALCGVAMADVDVTGKWSGSFNATNPNGETKESTAVLMLKQSGSAITGTVGPNDSEQFPIKKGTIDGDKITLEVDQDGNNITFTLKLASGRISGDAKASREGQTMTAKIDVGRDK
jgi:hypothetical protein